MVSSAQVSERAVGLDIVRSVAILWVLISHCAGFFSEWSGIRPPMLLSVSGFLGVELFFVLSGFLIGRLLLNIIDHQPNFHAWLVFMQRRWMRTLPLYFLWLGVLALVWPPYFWEHASAALWRDLPWFVTLTQNLAWPTVDGWFAVSWSLTVEEWFYLLFSALLIGGAALAGPRLAFWITTSAFLLLPPVLRWHVPANANWSTVTSQVVLLRLDAIAFGVLVSWMTVREARLIRHPLVLLAAGLALIGSIWAGTLQAAMFRLSAQAERTFIFDLASLGFALCLPAAAQLKQAWRWIAVPARAVSAQSYAMYLMHLSLLEIIGFYRTALNLSPPACILLVVGAIWGLSWLSYHWFEAPLLALRPPQGPRPAAIPLPGRETAQEMTSAH